MSLAMLDAAVEMGFRTIVATPHLMERLKPGYASQVQDAFRHIDALACSRGLELLTGFENRLSPDLPTRLQQGEPIGLGQSKAVLIDLPIIDWPHHADSTLFNVQTAGFQPVLAHPERYPRIQQDPCFGLELGERGIALQVTIGAFSGAFGKRTKVTAEKLIALRAVHLVATDAHSAGQRLMAVPAGLRRLEELVDRSGLRHLTCDAPRGLLEDGSVLSPIGLAPSGGTFSWLRAHYRGTGRDTAERR